MFDSKHVPNMHKICTIDNILKLIHTNKNQGQSWWSEGHTTIYYSMCILRSFLPLLLLSANPPVSFTPWEDNNPKIIVISSAYFQHTFHILIHYVNYPTALLAEHTRLSDSWHLLKSFWHTIAEIADKS